MFLSAEGVYQTRVRSFFLPLCAGASALMVSHCAAWVAVVLTTVAVGDADLVPLAAHEFTRLGSVTAVAAADGMVFVGSEAARWYSDFSGMYAHRWAACMQSATVRETC